MHPENLLPNMETVEEVRSRTTSLIPVRSRAWSIVKLRNCCTKCLLHRSKNRSLNVTLSRASLDVLREGGLRSVNARALNAPSVRCGQRHIVQIGMALRGRSPG